jgi:hypothetical protein
MGARNVRCQELVCCVEGVADGRFKKLDFDDFLSDSVPNEIGQACQFELQHDSSSVTFHSAHADAKLVGNLPIHFSLS